MGYSDCFAEIFRAATNNNYSMDPSLSTILPIFTFLPIFKIQKI